MITWEEHDVDRFREVIARRMGLEFDDGRTRFLAEVLHRRSTGTGRSYRDYLDHLARGGSPEELAALAQELTVVETYFFRNNEQFRALAQLVLPERLQATRGVPIRLLSAGCASGEEAYSLAMVLLDIVDPARRAPVLGIDLNPAALAKARRGRYSDWSLRETTPELQSRWFTREGREVVVDASVRANTTFELHNLASDDPRLWRPEWYDVVFCRNVTMYFTADAARAVMEHIARSLVPGGYLFLGHAESLRGVSADFHLCHTHGTFYYRRSQEASADSAQPDAAAAEQDWMEAVRSAAERVQRLTEPRTTATEAGPGQAPGPGHWDLGPALDALRQERFVEGVRLIEDLPPEAADDLQVLLLHAALLTHGNRLEAAEDICRRLLAIDAASAGARYLLGLCREGMGDSFGAAEQYREAIELDPTFAMPHLHLGLLARRSEDVDTARHELTEAITRLEQENPVRILLFGGGFGWTALADLCRAQLRSIEVDT